MNAVQFEDKVKTQSYVNGMNMIHENYLTKQIKYIVLHNKFKRNLERLLRKYPGGRITQK